MPDAFLSIREPHVLQGFFIKKRALLELEKEAVSRLFSLSASRFACNS